MSGACGARRDVKTLYIITHCSLTLDYESS